MSDSNPILFSSAQSIEAYQQAIEQSTQAVMQWLKQPEMYQGKTVAELRDRISLLRAGGEDADPAGLTRQQPGAMGLGTSRQQVEPPAGWVKPKKPDPMTKGRKR